MIFIHIPKTGGDSIEKHFSGNTSVIPTNQSMLPESYVYAAHSIFRKYGIGTNQWQHCRWRDVKPEIRNENKFFTIVRNPWSKAVSQYKFALKLVQEHGMNNASSIRLNTKFEEFLEYRHQWGKEPYFWQRTTVGWYNQKDYVTDMYGNLRVDVLRFEEYDKDTMSYLGLETPISKRNVTEKKSYDYREFYNNKSIQIIADWYEKDLEFFGFDFDSGATKNYWNNS